jgi:hypothetical protein
MASGFHKLAMTESVNITLAFDGADYSKTTVSSGVKITRVWHQKFSHWSELHYAVT